MKVKDYLICCMSVGVAFATWGFVMTQVFPAYFAMIWAATFTLETYATIKLMSQFNQLKDEA